MFGLDDSDFGSLGGGKRAGKAAKKAIVAHAPDRYDSRDGNGTRFAEAIILWQVPGPHGGVMPVPPGRRW